MQTIYKSEAGAAEVMSFYEGAIAAWPVPYQTMTVPTRHGETFVIACGETTAPPLLLIHGAGSNSAIWAGDAGEYSRCFRVYVVDLPGEPGKSAANRPSWEGPAFADWLSDVFDQLALEKAALVGISQGGWTALKFAAAYPDQVTELALICPGGVVADRPSFLLTAILSMALGKWGLRRMIRKLYADQLVPDGVEEITLMVSSHFKARIGVVPVFTDEELRRLSMPVFLIGGDQDIIRDNQQIAARLEGLLPDFRAQIVPGGGHALMYTVEPIQSFLAQPEHVM